jgi:hypothetical protein
MSRGGDG